MNRSKRAKIAEETLQVIDQGSYIRPDGTCVAIDSLHRHSIEQSLLIDDPKHEEMAATITTDFEFDSPTQFEVRNVTTLTAAKECYEKNAMKRMENRSLCA